MEFSWKKYFATMGFRGGTNIVSWTVVTNRYCVGMNRHDAQGVRLATELLYLAYRDAQDPAEHVCNVEYIRRYGLPCEPGLNYSRFWHLFPQERSQLGRGLQRFGAELLKNRAGDHCQYLRTIRRYSGSMYVRFAQTISGIVRSSSWNRVMEPGYLEHNAALQAQFNQYFGEGDEDVQSKKDIVVFFQTLSRLYRQYNKPFSRDDVLRLAPLTESVAQRIIDKMCTADEGAVDIESLDTLPSLSLTLSGSPVYVLPQEGHFADGVQNVCFLFKESASSSSEIAVAYYRKRKDGSFHLDVEPNCRDGFPFDGVGAIVRRRNATDAELRENQDRKTIEEDVMPLALKEAGADGVLLGLREIETGCQYALDTHRGNDGIVPLNAQIGPGLYKVVTRGGEIPELAFLKDDQLSPIEANTLDRYVQEGVFALGPGVDAVRIGATVYLCENEFSRYFDRDIRAGIVANPGSRLYYFDTTFPFSDEFENALNGMPGLEIFYALPDGRRESLHKEAAHWNVPETCLWQKGWLEFQNEGEILYRSALTFIEEPWADELEAPVDIDNEVDVQIQIGGDDVQVHANPRDTKVSFVYRGFNLSLPTVRKGVYFDCGGRALTLKREEPGTTTVTCVAMRDFEKTCHILADKDSLVLVTRGLESVAVLDDRRFSGSELRTLSSLKDESSERYCICVGEPIAMDCYKILVYDPSRAFVDANQTSRVVKRRDGDDLVLKYCIALSDAGGRKTIGFYPAHRQEEEIVWREPRESDTCSYQIDARGRCIETLRLKDFYCSEIDWGNGLLAYVGRKMPIHNRLEYTVEVFTAGFFIPCPEMNESVDFGDDPYGLRKAFAMKDHQTIESIMKSEDANIRAYLGGENGFLRRLQFESSRIKSVPRNGHRQSGRMCMNAYRNILPRRENGRNAGLEYSGYVFMAGWYYAPRIDHRGRMPEGLRDVWSPLMFAWKDLIDAEKIPTGFRSVRPSSSQLDYLPVAEKRVLRQLIERVTGEDCQQGGHCLFYERGWNYIRFSEAVRLRVIRHRNFDGPLNENQARVEQYARGMYRAWQAAYRGDLDADEIRNHTFPSGRFEGLRLFRPTFPQAAHLRHLVGKYVDVPYPVAAGYDFGLVFPNVDGPCAKYIGGGDLERFVDRVAEQLADWRGNPTLEGAQNLRETLLVVAKIDDSLRVLIESGTVEKKDGKMPSLTNVINERAWARHIQANLS